jgi:hypothetical protein
MRIGRTGSPPPFAAAQLNQIYNRNATAKIELSGQRDKKSLSLQAGNLPDHGREPLRR